MDQYVVIGNPIAHSKSPFLHAHFAKQTGQQINYQHLLAPKDDFAGTLQQFIQMGGKGANVTLPFKLDAFHCSTQLTARAQSAGAVNTLTFKYESELIIVGDNTDGCGLVRDITVNAGVTLTGKRSLLLGAGGAARGALLPLLECAPSELIIANRTAAKAQLLAQQFSAYGQIHAVEFGNILGQFDVVINATSASIEAALPPIASDVFSKNCLAYDMMYGDKPTIFMTYAAQHQAIIRDGWGMLVEQAAEAFTLWRGIRPSTAALLDKSNFIF